MTIQYTFNNVLNFNTFFNNLELNMITAVVLCFYYLTFDIGIMQLESHDFHKADDNELETRPLRIVMQNSVATLVF